MILRVRFQIFVKIEIKFVVFNEWHTEFSCDIGEFFFSCYIFFMVCPLEHEPLTCVSSTLIVNWRVRRLYREQLTVRKYTGVPSIFFSSIWPCGWYGGSDGVRICRNSTYSFRWKSKRNDEIWNRCSALICCYPLIWCTHTYFVRGAHGVANLQPSYYVLSG